MKRKEVIERLCVLVTRAWREIDPALIEPCDCLCRPTASGDEADFRFDDAALIWVEGVVAAAIAKRRADEAADLETYWRIGEKLGYS